MTFNVIKAMLTDPGAVPESALPLALAHASKDEIQRWKRRMAGALVAVLLLTSVSLLLPMRLVFM